MYYKFSVVLWKVCAEEDFYRNVRILAVVFSLLLLLLLFIVHSAVMLTAG